MNIGYGDPSRSRQLDEKASLSGFTIRRRRQRRWHRHGGRHRRRSRWWWWRRWHHGASRGRRSNGDDGTSGVTRRRRRLCHRRLRCRRRRRRHWRGRRVRCWSKQDPNTQPGRGRHGQSSQGDQHRIPPATVRTAPTARAAPGSRPRGTRTVPPPSAACRRRGSAAATCVGMSCAEVKHSSSAATTGSSPLATRCQAARRPGEPAGQSSPSPISAGNGRGGGHLIRRLCWNTVLGEANRVSRLCGYGRRSLCAGTNCLECIQQRIRLSYRRQRPTPLASCVAKNRDQAQLGVGGFDVAQCCRTCWLGLLRVAECAVLELAGDEAGGLIHQSGVDV